MESKPPQCFTLDCSWIKWKQKFEIFMLASGKSTQSEEIKKAILLNVIGDSGLDIYNTFPQEKVKTLKDVLDCFDEYFLPKRNVTMETFKFNSINQKDEQSIDSFITELKKQASNCEFVCTNDNCKQSYMDRMIKDRVILGLYDKQVQQRLIREADMSLEKIQEYCKSVELSKQHIKLLSHEEEVNAIKFTIKCSKCGFKHPPRKCPAYNKTCSHCQKKNHFANMCFYKGSRREQPSTTKEKDENMDASEIKEEQFKKTEFFNGNKIDRKKIEEIRSSEDNEPYMSPQSSNASKTVNSSNSVFICEQKSNVADVNKWHEEILVCNNLIKFKLDTGADSSILPLKYLNKLGITELDTVPSQITIISYGNFKSKPIGTITLKCFYKETFSNVKFLIVDFDSEPLLGLNDCLKFNLIKRVNVVQNILEDSAKLPNTKEGLYEKLPELFDGLGCLPGYVDIKLKSNAVPVIQTQRKVPLSLHTKLKETLDDLEDRNIISKVNYPTQWVNSMMIVEKPNGTLRLCLDPKPLNKYICREHYLIPRCEDILCRLEGKKIFTVIDMKDGFWQLQLNEDSSDLCTFNTPFGRYKFNRFPFGLSSGPEIFQRKCNELFSSILNVEIFFDDIIISGSDEKEHDIAFKAVIERALQYGVKFNFSKLQYKLKQVNFLGHIISENGVQPNNRNVEAILAIKEPQNRNELLRILGLFKFFSKFLPNLSQLTFNMRNLTKNNVNFLWTQVHQDELDTLKMLITNKPVLKIFDESKNIIIQTDASSKGLGCVLLQDMHPVAFASRSLNSSEVKYAQIEKELLSIVFALEKFHFFIYGKDVLVQTDHKPLIPILNKSLDKVTSRLQRLLLRLLKYRVKLEFLPGSKMYVADALSRSYINTHSPIDEELEYIVHSLSLHVPMTSEKKEIFRKAIDNDPILSQIKVFCATQWPKDSKNLNSELRYYFNLKDNIQLSEGLLFYHTKIIIPSVLRKEMLQLIHSSHFGIQKCKLRAREIMFWPKMSKDIEDLVYECEICQINRPANQKETLIPHILPDRPWQYLYSDILEHNNQNYLLIVDSYSHWLELHSIKDKAAKTIIEVCKNIFSVFGIPEKFYADNNPYNSASFKEFAKSWNFEIEFSSPYYHQSNGLAEKYVDISKQMLKKLKSLEDLPNSLLEYRNTILPSLGYSPSQLLLNKTVKSKIPACTEHLKPKIIDSEIVTSKLRINSEKQKQHYDKSSKNLPVLLNNEKVLFQKHNKWEKGKVVGQYNDRSYIIEDLFGNQFRRNRRLINKTRIPFDDTICEVYDDNFYDELFLNEPLDHKLTNHNIQFSNVDNNADARKSQTSNTEINNDLEDVTHQIVETIVDNALDQTVGIEVDKHFDVNKPNQNVEFIFEDSDISSIQDNEITEVDSSSSNLSNSSKCTVSMEPTSEKQIVTRSSRTSKYPARFNDFVTY